jgi:DNA-binding LacI/PurR family transcriptional regulator
MDLHADLEAWAGEKIGEGSEHIRWAVNSDKWVLQEVGWVGHATGLLNAKVTALAGMNDRLAQEEYFWLKLAGIAVPGRISMVSFDNIPESIAFPISTIDFGFGRLGYLAAHAFIGDIPISADRNGSVPGICTLIDRGSSVRAKR